MTEKVVAEKTVLETAIADFKRSVEITRDVRFQANLRLARRQHGSAYIVSLLSLYVIGLSLVPNFIKLEAYQSQILLACSIVLSVFVIFTSLIDSAQNFFHQGELLHQCARKIATVHHQLKNIDVTADAAAAKEDLEKLQRKYQDALDECPINHSNVDFYKEISTKPRLFPNQYQSKFLSEFIISLYYRVIYWILSYAWMTPHVLAAILISIVVYAFVLKGASPITT